MNEIEEVLVIDNIESFASECVDFLETVCNVKATMALTADEAKEKLKNLPIKIVLLDYDMPVNGLELFPELKKIDKNLEIVFVSAVATKEVLYKAEKFPFSAKIQKASCCEELPELIPLLLMKYKENTFLKKNDVFYTEYKRKLLFPYKIQYYICSSEIIDEKYVFEDSWHTTQMIQKGEKLEKQEEFNYEKIFDFSENFKIESTLETELDQTDIVNFKLGLSSQLENTIQSNYSENIKTAIKRIQELSIPETNDVNTAIVARYYDFANVYMQIKLRLKKHCTCCNSNDIIITTVYFPIPKVAYRIREYFDNKEPKTIDSGFYETGFSAPRTL